MKSMSLLLRMPAHIPAHPPSGLAARLGRPGTVLIATVGLDDTLETHDPQVVQEQVSVDTGGVQAILDDRQRRRVEVKVDQGAVAVEVDRDFKSTPHHESVGAKCRRG
jgi:hypothetical protein